jgi:hypothetical protein
LITAQIDVQQVLAISDWEKDPAGTRPAWDEYLTDYFLVILQENNLSQGTYTPQGGH